MQNSINYLPRVTKVNFFALLHRCLSEKRTLGSFNLVIHTFLFDSKLESYQGFRMNDFMNNWNVTSWSKYGVQQLNINKEHTTGEAGNGGKQDDQTWTPIIYAVLGFSALIVIFGIIGILYLVRSRRRYACCV